MESLALRCQLLRLQAKGRLCQTTQKCVLVSSSILYLVLFGWCKDFTAVFCKVAAKQSEQSRNPDHLCKKVGGGGRKEEVYEAYGMLCHTLQMKDEDGCYLYCWLAAMRIVAAA